jgi:uncharacterized protein YacL
MSLWFIRIFFLLLCSAAGIAVAEVRAEYAGPNAAIFGFLIGFGFGGLLIAIDEMLKGFSLRSFSATSVGLAFGLTIAYLVDHSGIFENAEHKTRWLIQLAMFLGFSYIGIILAMRSNKEDFSLIIPYIRFSPQNKPDNILLLDTSVIIDGRIADLIETGIVEGLIVVPRFVLRELQQIGDSNDPIRRARGRRGLDMLNRLQRSTICEVKIHDGDFPEEKEVDAKLVQLARHLNARLYTNDFNLRKIAELQSVKCVNIHDAAKALKTVLLPGEIFRLKVVREGKEKDQGVGYMPDGTMVVVNRGHALIGQEVEVEVQSLLQTGAGVIVFAEAKGPNHKGVAS